MQMNSDSGWREHNFLMHSRNSLTCLEIYVNWKMSILTTMIGVSLRYVGAILPIRTTAGCIILHRMLNVIVGGGHVNRMAVQTAPRSLGWSLKNKSTTRQIHRKEKDFTIQFNLLYMPQNALNNLWPTVHILNVILTSSLFQLSYKIFHGKQ